VTTSLPGFDDSLNRQLEVCARDAGVDVDTYITRAVGAQMVADLVRAEDPVAKGLLARLSEAGIFATDEMPDVSAAVNDPDRLRSLYDTGLLDSPPTHARRRRCTGRPVRSDITNRRRPAILQEHRWHGWIGARGKTDTA
jgi:hypothetical protein